METSRQNLLLINNQREILTDMRWTFHSNCPDQRDFHFDARFALSQRLVRAIAERRGLGLLALAQGDFFLFIY